jgi:hypothetical protein
MNGMVMMAQSDSKFGMHGSFTSYMEAVDEQNDWILFYRTIDGSYLRRLRR